MRRIGLFGGTFDPPHLGHLAIAEWARDRLGLARVIFMPSGKPPHKPGDRISSVDDRLKMTRLAVRGVPGFTVSVDEARRRGPSFTIETLSVLRAREPNTRLYLIMGEDSLREFGTWHEPEAILSMARLVVALRPGGKRSPGRGSGPGHRSRPGELSAGDSRVTWLDNPGLELSSSSIRAWVRAGRSVRFLVPTSVAHYIRRHRLYRQPR